MGLNFESIFHLRQRMAFKSIYDEATRRFDTIGKWAYFPPIESSGVQHALAISREALFRPMSMIKIIRTNSEDPDFITLVKSLDADLAIRDGKDHSFYAQYNKIDKIRYVVLAYDNGIALGCGAIKEYSADTMEVKRMYVPPESRNKGIATQILSALEQWAGELQYSRCILETGKKQPEAIALYRKNGYAVIPNYGQYAGVENSVCFEKYLK